MFQIVHKLSKSLLAGILVCCLATAIFHHSHLDGSSDSQHNEATCELCVAHQFLGNGLAPLATVALLFFFIYRHVGRAQFVSPFIPRTRFTINSALDPPVSL